MNSRKTDVIDIEVVKESRLDALRRLLSPRLTGTMSLVPYRPQRRSLVGTLVANIVATLAPSPVEVIEAHLIEREEKPVLDRLTGRTLPRHTWEKVRKERAQEEACARAAFQTKQSRRPFTPGPSFEAYRQFGTRGAQKGQVVYWWTRDSNGNFATGGTPRS